MKINNEVIEIFTNFKYFGFIIYNKGGCTQEVRRRLAMAEKH